MPEQSSPRKFVSDFREGELLYDHTDPESGLRLLVTRGGFCFCAYVGVEADHTLAGLDDFSFPCHWGVNFTTWGKPGTSWPEGWFWWGWDYGHAFDARDFLADLPEDTPESLRELLRQTDSRRMEPGPGVPRVKNWTLDAVILDGLDVVMELREALQASNEFSTCC
ncbi:MULTISPECIES: hypothetical protein [unclassified Variovorax]|uniref:hypothetical protein n=1 Tax=unclassified Variovorax TaxID=663243 RepID=UPI0008393E9E|nr:MULTISPECIES: hypothetical protein [unclassified Variovorax]PNG49820.1 hypothetical protein CHC06_05401 [Variovorax sp. B2]PNG50692.1 hypothetical protein CHC07_05306 [Variovorax sp. B4]VTV17885.1 hypothetical protein WDL1P1_00739 [Variovorax sp. WDL1]